MIADAQNLASIQDGVSQSIKIFGNIDAAIHNACFCTFENEQNSDYTVYQKAMDVNFFGALRLAKTVLPYMRKAQKGRIIFTSSGVGITGFANISPYASTKGAIESLAKCLEIENAAYGISFHLFHPPLTNTASAQGLPIPKEFKADPQVVGYGLADHLWSKKFVICHSFIQELQIRFSYHHPLYIGRLMTKMTKRAEEKHEIKRYVCSRIPNGMASAPQSTSREDRDFCILCRKLVRPPLAQSRGGLSLARLLPCPDAE